jgi:hypothetical protein
MPRLHDIKKVMIIGSGPIIIGQACEPSLPPKASPPTGRERVMSDPYKVTMQISIRRRSVITASSKFPVLFLFWTDAGGSPLSK